MPKIPSPCIDVCKFSRRGPAGVHCKGCSMTKRQRRIAKGLKGSPAMADFVALVRAQQLVMGRYLHWQDAYAKRCAKRGLAAPKDWPGDA